MRMPKKPPEMAELWSTIGNDPQRLVESMRLTKASSKIGYPHWDKLMRLKPPSGLSAREWWFGIKMMRSATLKEVPLLKSKTGTAFTYSLPDPVPEQLHNIDLKAGGRNEMPEQLTNPETKDQYYVKSLIEEAITSSQLEGATTTRKVAENLIRTGRKPQDRSETMILNNYQTMKRISVLKTTSLSPELVLEIHSSVTRGTLDDSSAEGRLRRSDEDIVVSDSESQVFHRPPQADELPGRLEAMCEFANGNPKDVFIHPILRSVMLHFWLAYDHPFVDGNGRAARALFYWSILHQGYWLGEYISISQILLKAPAKYSRSFLYTETDDNDMTYFILHHLDVICRSIDELHAFFKRRATRLKRMASQVRNIDMLNHRQRALLSHALRHPGHQYTITSHRISHDIVYETSRSDLLELARRNLLHSGKLGRKWYFTAPQDLEGRLSN